MSPREEFCLPDSGVHCVTRLIDQLEAYPCAGLVLHDARAREYLLAANEVTDPQRDGITATQRAVYGLIEQCKIAGCPGHAKLRAHAPDLPQLQRWFLSDELALVPGSSTRGLFRDGVAHRLFPLLVLGKAGAWSGIQRAVWQFRASAGERLRSIAVTHFRRINRCVSAGNRQPESSTPRRIEEFVLYLPLARHGGRFRPKPDIHIGQGGGEYWSIFGRVSAGTRTGVDGHVDIADAPPAS